MGINDAHKVRSVQWAQVPCPCCTNLLTQGLSFSSQQFPTKNSYLTHLSMEGDGSESKISEQQSRSLSIVTGAAEYHKGVASQFIEYINQVGVLNHEPKTKYITDLEDGLETQPHVRKDQACRSVSIIQTTSFEWYLLPATPQVIRQVSVGSGGMPE